MCLEFEFVVLLGVRPVNKLEKFHYKQSLTFFSLEENKQGHFCKNSVLFSICFTFFFFSAIELWKCTCSWTEYPLKDFLPNYNSSLNKVRSTFKRSGLLFNFFVCKAILIDFNWYQHFRSGASNRLSLSGKVKINF